MGLPAGQLPHRLKFYRQTTTRTPTGAIKSGEWQHAFTVWGHFSDLSGKDVMLGQVAHTDITARAKIRYRKGISHNMQVEYDGQMYAIVGRPLADNRTGREYLTVMLKEVKND